LWGLAVVLFLLQLFGSRLGKHVLRFGHLNQLLPVFRVTHLCHFSAFGGARFVPETFFIVLSRLKPVQTAEWRQVFFSSFAREVYKKRHTSP
jgi:hypothetical protein